MLKIFSLARARRKNPTDGRSKGRWSIKQLLRTKEERLSYAIFEIKWGNAISRKALHPARDTFRHKSHRTWRLWHVQGWLQQDLVFVMSAMKMQVSDMQWPENVLPLRSMNALCIRWLPSVMPTRWHSKGTANNSTFRIACGLSILVGQNWADNGYTLMNNAPGHASRDVKSENLPHCTPCAFEVFEGTACWNGWCGRGHQKEDHEHWRLLYIDILRVRNVHVYRQLPRFLCVWESRHFKYWKNKCHVYFWQMTFFFFFFFFEIEILIRVALFDGLAWALWSFQPREEEFPEWWWKNEQTRGRQIRRRGKQRERLKPGLAV